MQIKPIFTTKSSHGTRLIAVVVVAALLMFADCRLEKFKNLRMHLSVVVYPLQKIVDFPIDSYFSIYNYFVSKNSLIAENSNLYTAQLLLKGELQKLVALELENQRLRELLHSTKATKEDLLVANILRIDPDPFMHQIILDKGRKEAVYIGQPITDARGIMGSVIEVNNFTSRVMLLTDASHAVPVENVRNGVRAIAMGVGATNHLELKHVTNTADIMVGDTLVTSGLDGRYPAGYPVGTVINKEHDNSKLFASIYVAPSAELARGRQVLLIKPREESE